MHTIDLLLVGDIHFPQSKLDLDYKDDGVSIEYAKSISLSPLRVVIDEIEKLAISTNGILFCGDLTSWGDAGGYEECVDWLEKTLKIKEEVFWKHDEVHVVPGNHDVDRSLCKPGTVADKAKFEPFLSAWKKHGLEHLLTLEHVRQTRVQSGQHRCGLFSLNSCLGCGEFRGLPEKMRKSVADELEPLLKSSATRTKLDDDLKNRWESLDSPAFVGSEIEELLKGIGQLENGEVPLVLSHHNVLPQKTVRIALYTELLNGGSFRYEMAMHSSPIVYLHGHIHADPIEVVSLPEPDATPFICVSAPEMRQGFLLLRIVFGTRKSPLGIEIVPYRTSHGNTRCEPSRAIRIPFWKPTQLISKSSSNARKAFADLELTDGVARFGDVQKQLQHLKLTDRRLAEALEELEWLGLLEIANRTDTYDHWQISGAA